MSLKRLSTALLLWPRGGVRAIPHPQDPGAGVNADPGTSNSIVPVTSTTVVDGATITAVFTPTSLSVTGLAPPITAATTVTTTNDQGATIAVAVAAGAGIVAAGALAAWLFEPAPVVPPAPTSAPPYSTSSQEQAPPSKTDPENVPTSTATEPAACPFDAKASEQNFAKAEPQPEWTGQFPIVLPKGASTVCHDHGANGELLRGSQPGFVQKLINVFCKDELAGDKTLTLSKNDLPDPSQSQAKERIIFNFKSKGVNTPECAKYCQEPLSYIVTECQYDKTGIFGGGESDRGCGTYSFTIDADPRTELKCMGDDGNVMHNYMMRDALVGAINNFCTAQNGKVIKPDQTSWLQERTFTVRYRDNCRGAGSFTVEHDACVDYMMHIIDNCDTATTLYKHGGILGDIDSCEQYEVHPGYSAEIQCMRSQNQPAITKAMARDAITQFCERSGGDQKYTLYPTKPPNQGFSQDTCTTDGMASCGSGYQRDGSRAPNDKPGDLRIRLGASFRNDEGCSPQKVYDIHGDRCKTYLGEIIGDGPVKDCAANENDLDLGVLYENGENGCVQWFINAVKTTNW